MRGKRLGTGVSVLAGALAVCGLAFAPTAAAVAPGTATITADCGSYGNGAATLTATQNGTAATLTLKTSAITAPLALGQDSIVSRLTLVKAGGGTTVFSGTKNPAMAAGDPVTVGPLTGTVASGDRLEAYGGSLRMTVFGFITLTCTAGGPCSGRWYGGAPGIRENGRHECSYPEIRAAGRRGGHLPRP